MHGVYWILLYYITLVSSIVGFGFLTLYNFHWPATMELNILFSSLNMIIFAIFYVLFECVKCILCRRCHRRCINHEYSNLTKGETDIVAGRPRLLMQDVWVLVYGVGLCFYVIAYVSTCMDLLSMQFFAYGLLMVIVQEIATTGMSFCAPENVLYAMSAGICTIGMVVKGLQDDYLHFTAPVKEQNLLIIMYGVCLPYTLFIFMLGVKGNKKYMIGNMYDLCEFGFPFAIILSVCTCGTFKMFNCDTNWGIEFEPSMLSLTVTPIALLVIFISVIEALQNAHILDTLISYILAAGLFDLIRDSTNKFAFISLSLGLIAMVVRLSLFLPIIQKNNSHIPEITTPLSTHVIEEEHA